MIFFFRFIRNTILSFAVLASVFALAFAMKTGRAPTIDSSREVLSTVIPALDDSCRFPILYQIGAIDPSFHFSTEELASALREAETLWETGIGRDLFAASEREAAIPVNLVYDDRQERTNSIKEVSSDIEIRKAEFERLQSEYGVAAKEFDRKKEEYELDVKRYEKNLAAYESRVKKYQDRLSSYEKQVIRWNAGGGVSADEYEAFEDERKALKQEASDLEDERDDLNDEKQSIEKEFRAVNTLAGKANTLAGSLNRLATALNMTVDSYNRVFGTREEFTTGLYTRDESGERIDVFQFYDRADLVLILAHEMGHALGVEHANDSASLMHPSIGGQAPSLSSEDKNLFAKRCPM